MKRIFLFLALLLPMTLGAEDLRVAHIFSDHMVLQRESTVPVWGWGDPGKNRDGDSFLVWRRPRNGESGQRRHLARECRYRRGRRPLCPVRQVGQGKHPLCRCHAGRSLDLRRPVQHGNAHLRLRFPGSRGCAGRHHQGGHVRRQGAYHRHQDAQVQGAHRRYRGGVEARFRRILCGYVRGGLVLCHGPRSLPRPSRTIWTFPWASS